MKKKFLFIIGTRPEAIKLALLIKECKLHNQVIEVKICITGQHKELLNQVLDFFEFKADFDLSIMRLNQSLSEITTNCLTGIEEVLKNFEPDLVLIQGDTTTAFSGALAAFYRKIKIAHIEAGLRSNNKYSPFPEELNRKLISALADFHFAPTLTNSNNLLAEGISNIYVTGNTVIDALMWSTKKIKSLPIDNNFPFYKNGSRFILVTSHRRENFGNPLEQICKALKHIANEFPKIHIVFVVHLNPQSKTVVVQRLSGIKNITLLKPQDYPHFLWLMCKSHFIITDSGGIQEEASVLGKPILILRDLTERYESVRLGISKLVGSKAQDLFKSAQELLLSNQQYNEMSRSINVYGDGKSAKRIIKILLNEL